MWQILIYGPSGAVIALVKVVRYITGQMGEMMGKLRARLDRWYLWLRNAARKSYNYRPILEHQT